MFEDRMIESIAENLDEIRDEVRRCAEKGTICKSDNIEPYVQRIIGKLEMLEILLADVI